MADFVINAFLIQFKIALFHILMFFSLPFFQGLYVFVVYFILHNQLCCPVKASYTVDMNGHSTPGSPFFTHGSGMPAPGGEISKSTQNLISAMEEVPICYTSCHKYEKCSYIFDGKAT